MYPHHVHPCNLHRVYSCNHVFKNKTATVWSHHGACIGPMWSHPRADVEPMQSRCEVGMGPLSQTSPKRRSPRGTCSGHNHIRHNYVGHNYTGHHGHAYAHLQAHAHTYAAAVLTKRYSSVGSTRADRKMWLDRVRSNNGLGKYIYPHSP